MEWVYICFFPHEKEIINYPPKEGPVVAFGDSFIKGVWTNENENFVALLSERIAEPILNYGVPGDTTIDGLARIDEVIEVQPRIVILLLGGNDYLKRIPRAETFLNVKTIIQRLQASGAVVVLLGIRGGLLNDHFDTEFEKLAEAMGVVFVPDVLDGIFGKSVFMSDTVHPNKDGYQLIFDKVYPELERVLK